MPVVVLHFCLVLPVSLLPGGSAEPLPVRFRPFLADPFLDGSLAALATGLPGALADSIFLTSISNRTAAS